MKTLDAVVVTWIDSSSTNDWTPVDEAKQSLGLTHSFGILAAETENSLILALSYDSDTDSINCFKHIPLVAIQKVKRLCKIPMKS